MARVTGHHPLRAVGAALAAVAALACAVAAPASAAPASSTVLVRIDPTATAPERAEVAADLAAGSSRALMAGWRAYRVPSRVTDATAERLLAGDPAAAAVEIDLPVRPLLTPDDTLFAQQWDMTRIGAPALWDGPAGSPVTVAIVDTGVDVSHPDLSGALWSNPDEIPGNLLDDDHDGLVDDVHGWDFFHGDATLFDSPALDEHGTHVAGTIAATRGNAAGVAGVASAARIMPLKFIEGTGTIANAVLALQYARDHGARVVNASFGTPSYSVALCDAVAALSSSGVIMVSAAGNSALDNDVARPTPAACEAPGNIAVAATTQADALASYSNHGASSVDIAAPGSSILSTIPGGLYDLMNGTSMAAPHVTGAAAAILARTPALSPVAVKTALVEGGEALPALAGMTQRGTLLAIPAALARIATPDPDAAPPDPFATTTPADGLASTATRPAFAWAEALDHGTGTASYRVVVDGAQAAQVAPETLGWTPPSALGEGAHAWRVDAWDGSGNIRASATRTVIVDTTPPAPFSITSPATVDTLQPTVTWSAATDASSQVVRYEVSTGATFVTLPSTQTSWTLPTPSLAPPQTVTVRAVDAAGNGRIATQTISYLAPTPPPQMTGASPVDGFVGRRPTLRWTPAQAGPWGLAAVRVRLDGATVAELGATATSWSPAADLAVGPHTWTVVAVDAKGRESAEPGPYTVSVTAPAPEPDPVTPPSSTPVTPPPPGTAGSTWRTVVVRVRPLSVPRRYVARVVRSGRTLRRFTGTLPAGRRTLRLRVPRALTALTPRPRIVVVLITVR